MGAFNSVHTPMSQQEEEEEEEDTGVSDCTPRHVNKRDKRILSTDPRSPSECIARTPIIVDKTPNRSHAAKAHHDSDVLLDPRSPSAEFTRTPLCLGNTQTASHQAASVQSSLHTPSGTPVSHHSMTSESGIESAEVTPVLKQANKEEDVFSSPDSAVNSEIVSTAAAVSNDSLSESDNSETICINELPSPVSPEYCDEAPLIAKDLQSLHLSTNSESTRLVQTEKSPSDNLLRLRPFALGKKFDTTTPEAKNVRSPLSYVDNSTRYGRLHKSSTKTATNKLNAHTDKENVCH